MTWALTHPHSRPIRSTSAKAGSALSSIRWPRGLVAISILALLASAWGGLVPYLGPAIGYNSNGAPSWQWTLSHSLLYLVPGAVGVAASLAVMTRARGGWVLSRAALMAMGLLLGVCGAWFVLGPAAWHIMESGSIFGSGMSALRLFATQVGYNDGIGLALAMLGGMVISSGIAEREIPVIGVLATGNDRGDADGTRARPPSAAGRSSRLAASGDGAAGRVDAGAPAVGASLGSPVRTRRPA